MKKILNLRMRELFSQHIVIYTIAEFLWYFAILMLGAFAIHVTVLPVINLPFAQAISSTFIIVICMRMSGGYPNKQFKDWLIEELFAKSLMFSLYSLGRFTIYSLWGI